MNKELILQLAKLECKSDKLSDFMICANQICKQNNSSNLSIFANVDIVFAKFVDVLKLESQVIKDYVFVSENLTKAYNYLHIDMMLFKEPLSEYKIDVVKNTLDSLTRLNQVSLLTDGLNKKVMKFVKEIMI